MKTLCACLLVTLAALSCQPSGTPGVSGTVSLSGDVLINQGTATRIFVGAYSADLLRNDGWPERWADAKFSTSIDNLTPKDFDYSFVTGSSERLYIYAFLDQNGGGEDTNPEPGVIDVNGESVADVIGKYAKNPVVPIDDMLNGIDIELNVVLQ